MLTFFLKTQEKPFRGRNFGFSGSQCSPLKGDLPHLTHGVCRNRILYEVDSVRKWLSGSPSVAPCTACRVQSPYLPTRGCVPLLLLCTLGHVYLPLALALAPISTVLSVFDSQIAVPPKRMAYSPAPSPKLLHRVGCTRRRKYKRRLQKRPITHPSESPPNSRSQALLQGCIVEPELVTQAVLVDD